MDERTYASLTGDGQSRGLSEGSTYRPPTRRPRNQRRRVEITDGVTPTPHEQRMEQLTQCLNDFAERSEMYLQAQLQASVQTLDTVVYEHDTVELPTTQDWFTFNLIEQTRQTELITSLFASITVPALKNATPGAAPTIDITNAYAQLGDQLVNLNAILNSSGGTGGALPGTLAFVLRSDSVRSLTIVASANWPANAYLSFALFGCAVPATLGEVLH